MNLRLTAMQRSAYEFFNVKIGSSAFIFCGYCGVCFDSIPCRSVHLHRFSSCLRLLSVKSSFHVVYRVFIVTPLHNIASIAPPTLEDNNKFFLHKFSYFLIRSTNQRRLATMLSFCLHSASFFLRVVNERQKEIQHNRFSSVHVVKTGWPGGQSLSQTHERTPTDPFRHAHGYRIHFVEFKRMYSPFLHNCSPSHCLMHSITRCIY